MIQYVVEVLAEPLYLEFEKVDTVCHEKLFEHLRNCGMTGGVIDLFKNYIIGQPEIVKAGNSPSSDLIVKSIIPQRCYSELSFST